MVRQVDTPSPLKHLRFGKISPQLSDILIGFPGVKSIVLHTHGAKGEHPHYHVWWEGDTITNETIRNRLRKHNDIFKSYSGQNEWSCRPHDSFETWAAYVQRNKTHQVLWTSVDMPPPKDVIELVIATPQTPQINTPVPRVKKLTSEERLINYCIVEEGFKYNQWGKPHYEVIEYRTQMHDKIAETLVAYANGRLDQRQMVYMGRNIMYTFADLDLKEFLAKQWSHDARKYW